MSSQTNDKKRSRQKEVQDKASQESSKANKKQKTNPKQEINEKRQASSQSKGLPKQNERKILSQQGSSNKQNSSIKESSEQPAQKHNEIKAKTNQQKQDPDLSDANAKKKSYKKVKLSEEEYRVGDNVIVLVEGEPDEEGNKPFSVGRIDQIFILNDNKTKPYVKVTWYMTAKEINKSFDFFGDSELFLSNAQEQVEATSLDGHCQILTLDQYEQSEEKEGEDPVFFTRASWDFQTQQFDPPISQWPKNCYCKKPSNPDLAYVQCDNCEK